MSVFSEEFDTKRVVLFALGCGIALLLLIPTSASAQNVVFFDQDFENPNAMPATSPFVDLSQTPVNDSYGGQPAGFLFAQQFTVETLFVDNGNFLGTGYLDPTGRAGNYALGLLDAQDDRLGIAFDASGFESFEVAFDFASTAVQNVSNGATFAECSTCIPRIRLRLFDDPGGTNAVNGNGTLLQTVDIVGTASPANALQYMNAVETIDLTGATNGNVVLQFDLITPNGASDSGYVAIDNIQIQAATGLEVVKTSATDLTVAGGATVANVNDEIDYTYTVTNTGNVTLTGVGVVEPNNATNDFTGTGIVPSPVLAAGSSTTLAPGESATFTATYALTQADINAGSVSNSAVATGSSPGNTGDVTDISGTAGGNDTPTTTNILGPSELTVSKTLVNADDAEVDTLNEVIEYTIVVANTGTTDLTNVALTDTISSVGNLSIGAPVGDSVDPGVLNVGETWTYTVNYTVSQDDLDDGSDLVNTASVVTDEVTTAVVDTATSSIQLVDIEVIEEILSDDLLQTTSILSQNASDISRRAADRLRVNSGQACGQEINNLLQSSPVQFATAKFFIDERNTVLLDRIAVILSECDNSSFMIAGHTDSDGSDAYNLVLSQNRVDAVEAALIRRGVADQRLQTRGFGERRPIATNATEEGKALNRRVEFILLGESLGNTDRLCGEGNQPSRSLDGIANDDGATLNGAFASSRYNCVSNTHTETWAEVNVTHDEERGTLGVGTFGISRDAQANGILRGRFVEGYLSKNDVDTGDATGTITGVGIHAGLYGAHATDRGLILSYYGSAAVGQHTFDLTAGSEVDGNYAYVGLFAGGTIGGETEVSAAILRPRVGIDLAYAEAIGSEISVPNVDLDLEIDPVTVARGFVEVGLEHEADNGIWNLKPRLFCESNPDANACGFGTAFDYFTQQDADGSQWSVGFDYALFHDRKSGSLKLAYSTEVFNGLGASRSSFSATATGTLQVAQTVEFAW